MRDVTGGIHIDAHDNVIPAGRHGEHGFVEAVERGGAGFALVDARFAAHADPFQHAVVGRDALAVAVDGAYLADDQLVDLAGVDARVFHRFQARPSAHVLKRHVFQFRSIIAVAELRHADADDGNRSCKFAAHVCSPSNVDFTNAAHDTELLHSQCPAEPCGIRSESRAG